MDACKECVCYFNRSGAELCQKDDVAPYAHLEFSNGFLVFDRRDRQHEVWQRVSSQEADPSPAAGQIETETEYRQHTILTSPNSTRAYRFVYPLLLVASGFAMEAYIWHVPSATLLQTVNLGDRREGINYVDVSETHIFVCFSGRVSVYRRGDGNLVFQLPGPPSNPELIQRALSRAGNLGSISQQHSAPARLQTLSLGHYPIDLASVRDGDEYTAVHVSPCGQNLVAVTELGLVFYVRDFANSSNLEERIWAMSLNSHTIYLAYDGKRIAVCTVGVSNISHPLKLLNLLL